MRVLSAFLILALTTACESVPQITFADPDGGAPDAVSDAPNDAFADGGACPTETSSPPLGAVACCRNGAACAGTQCTGSDLATSCAECEVKCPGALCCTKLTGAGVSVQCRSFGSACP